MITRLVHYLLHCLRLTVQLEHGPMNTVFVQTILTYAL